MLPKPSSLRLGLAASLLLMSLPASAQGAGLAAKGVLLGSNAPNVRTTQVVSFVPKTETTAIRRIDLTWCAQDACTSAPAGISTAKARTTAVEGAGAGWRRAPLAAVNRVTFLNSEGAVPQEVVRLRLDAVRNADVTRGASIRVTTFADLAGTQAIDSDAVPYSVLRGPSLWVAPWGSDRNDGSYERPFRELGRALSLSAGGQTIQVASGAYAGVYDRLPREATVLVRGYGPTPPTFGELSFAGGQRVALENIKLTSLVVREGPTGTAPSSGIALRSSEVTAGGRATGRCVYAANGATAVTVRDSHLHDCKFGIQTSVSSPTPVSGTEVSDNLFAHFAEDAIQIARFHSTLLQGNVIRDARGGGHSDGIQVMGGISGLDIRANRISEIDNQGIIVKEEPGVGPVNGIAVQGNVIRGTGLANAAGTAGWSLDLLSGDGSRVVGNTVWAGLGVRLGPASTNTILVENAIRRLEASPAALTDWRRNYVGNYTSRALSAAAPKSDINWCLWPAKGWVEQEPVCSGTPPGFADAASGDLRPAAGSALLGGDGQSGLTRGAVEGPGGSVIGALPLTR